jgi:hypothetical protein
VYGDPRRSLDDVRAVVVGAPDNTSPVPGRDFSVREVLPADWPAPIFLTPEEAAAAEAANRARAAAEQAVRVRRLPGERFISSDVDMPCFLGRVATEAGTARAWLLEYE